MRDLDESVTGHVLDALVCLVHELKELCDNRLEETPMSAQEAGVLAYDVHNVTRDNRLVVLAPFVLAEAQEVANHDDEEGALVVLLHSTRDTADGPTEGVQVGPRPLASIHLTLQLLEHYLFGVLVRGLEVGISAKCYRNDFKNLL